MKTLLSSLLGILILLSACGGGPSGYLSPSFKMKAQTHKTVAVLPYEVVTNGKLPEGMTAEQKSQIEIAEAKAFQQSLYNELVSHMGRSPVQIQLPHKTNNLLQGKGITLNQIAQRNPEDLAQMLGVDAVVFATVIKHRYMENKESVITDVAKQNAEQLFRNSRLSIPDVSSTTNDVKVTYSLVEAKGGEVLWKTDKTRGAKWNKPVNVVIDQLNRELTIDFPYQFLRYRN